MPRSSTAPAELACQRHTLDNGLRLVLHPDRGLPLVTVDVWYHVGSKNERPGRTGFAHLFEHMLFQGSENVGTNDHFRYIQQAGGVANGSTWYDRTNYYETLPGHYLELGLWLESDRLGFLLPAMTQEKLDNQREVVINERRQRVDNQPYGRAMERVHELLYPGHPYHWPVIGYMEDIAAATLDDVQEFFHTYYTPNNAVLTLAGDFEPDAARELVERWFGGLPRGPQVPAVEAELVPLGGERREVLGDDVLLPRVYMAHRAPRFGDEVWYAADVLATALSSGKASLLYEELVYRRQIAQDVISYVYPTEIAATFLTVATARPGVDPAEVEAALGEVLARCADEPLPEERLERARARVLQDFWIAMEKLDGRADLLSQYTTYFDDPERVVGEPERYRRIRAEAVRDYARRWCVADERVVVTVVPREAP
ncbi:MAG TPA: pitrilysin family protein [Thermoanaerobaculia bacterium]|nr:pitrilysin family protein [Thermoanaerobaculia bacterium]